MITQSLQGVGFPDDEGKTYLQQLEGLGLISIGIKMSGAEFRMVNMTKEGLEETSEVQDIR